MRIFIGTGCGAAGVPAHGIAAAGRGRGGSGARAALQGALPYLVDDCCLTDSHLGHCGFGNCALLQVDQNVSESEGRSKRALLLRRRACCWAT